MSDIGRIVRNVEVKAAVSSSGPSLQAWAWVWGVPVGVGKAWITISRSCISECQCDVGHAKTKKRRQSKQSGKKLDKIKP